MQKDPPQLPFSVHKKQVRKRMASVGAGGWMEGENVFVWHIYVCVKQKWNRKNMEYLCYSLKCILFSFTFFHFT